MKKTLLILMLTLLSAVLLTGCSSSADTLASPTPGATNMLDNLLPGTGTATESPMMDNATMMPEVTAAPAATIEDTRKTVQAMEEAVEKLSEVDDAYVITLGDTALVGLEFEGQYQGGTDERLKKMVLARLQTVDKNISKVAVTSDEPLVTSIEALTEALKSASSLEEVNKRAEEVLKQLTVYGG